MKKEITDLRINWGSVIIDGIIIICAATTKTWALLLLIFFTGGYRLKKDTEDDN